jgi:hypothetical protein
MFDAPEVAKVLNGRRLFEPRAETPDGREARYARQSAWPDIAGELHTTGHGRHRRVDGRGLIEAGANRGSGYVQVEMGGRQPCRASTIALRRFGLVGGMTAA